MSMQLRAYEKLSSIRPAVTLPPVDTIKLENVCECEYMSGLLLPYVDGVNLTWGDQWPALEPHTARARIFESMAAVRNAMG